MIPSFMADVNANVYHNELDEDKFIMRSTAISISL